MSDGFVFILYYGSAIVAGAFTGLGIWVFLRWLGGER